MCVCVCVASNCRHITNTKSKENIFHIVKINRKLLVFQCLVEWKHIVALNNFCKGCGELFKVDFWQKQYFIGWWLMCVSLPQIQRIKWVPVSQESEHCVDQMFQAQRQWNLLITYLMNLLRLTGPRCNKSWPCFSQVTPRFWRAFTVQHMGCVNQTCPVRTKYYILR